MIDRLRIIVLGYMVRGPVGGMAWHHLQYVTGLAALGHEVYFLEDSDDYPSCYDPSRHVTDTDPTYGLGFAKEVFDKTGVGERWAFYDAHKRQWHGPCATRALDICASADLLINVSGVNPMRGHFARIPIRVLIDTDPVFTQIRHCTDPARKRLAQLHTHFFSFGENITRAFSDIPDDGFRWKPTRQPIVLGAWEVSPGPTDGWFTTVMQWDSYPAREFAGVRYGVKADSFGPYMDLPARAGHVLEVALGSPSAPRQLFAERGWRLQDPMAISRDPWSYQRYIQQSKAEFTVAKHGYVISRCGWFSERSAAYLASGRPVLTQETGFSDWMETGRGILSFTTPDEALAGIEEISGRYELHCKEARKVAERYFDSKVVLAHLVESALSV